MEEKHLLNPFDGGSTAKAVFKYTLPSIAAMLMGLVYNLADTFFISLTNNDYMIAAVSIATPVFFIFMSIGSLFGIGGTSAISRAMGEGNVQRARKLCSFCMYGCIGVGVIITLMFWLFMDELLVALGTSPDTTGYTRTYLNIVASSGVFAMISNCYSNIIRAEGSSTAAMGGTLLGNLLNVILDPILILAFDLDIAGAAIATVIGNVAAALFYLIYFWSGRSELSIHIRDFAIGDKIASSVILIGVPASLGHLLMSFSQMLTNNRLADYGDLSVAAFGVAAKVLMITSTLSFGLGNGVQPLLGWCYGAQDRGRFTKCLRFSLGFAFVLLLSVAAVCFVFARPIVAIFLTEPSALDTATLFLRIMLASGWLMGMICVLTNALQAMGAATASLIASICRQGIIFIPAVLIMGYVLGRDGLVWAQPVADVLSLVWVIVLLARTMKRNKFGKDV